MLKNATIYSSYDPNLPAYAQSANWDLISYMLNERFCEPGSIFATASAATFQNAVWFFKYGLSTFTPPANDPSWALIENAKENGENFIPCACDDEDCHWFAGIIWPGTSTGGPGIGGNYPTDYQMLIFALDP